MIQQATLGIYPRENKAYTHAMTSTQILMAALFVMAKKWKLSNFPSTDEWINCSIAIQ